ncbi:MAG TPA: glucoamylase family protein, partial [Rhizomicrobium sp.]|nr:glucoamylase family protein [Rhizomicrobium sp.]
VRGDWQLLPWVFGHGRTTRDGSHRTPIPLMGRWKLLDNLRRSLSAPAALLGLLVAWLMRLHVAEVWTGYVVLTIAVPPLIPAFAGVVPQRVGISQRNHWRGVGRDLGLGLTQSAFLITFLAHQAWMTVDAIARTLFRVVTRRRLLEWVTAAQADEVTPFDRRTLAMQIVASAIFAAVVGLLMYYAGHGGWRVSVPFAVMWLFSPAVARWASLPAPAAEHFILEADDARELRLVARRTWRYFEDFVTADDNMLPPDNFQEEPKPVVARRTSPTNIGLYLLSVVAARDFGWLGTLDVLDRVEATFATLDKLEKFRGHFYNWYATADLRALEPKYVSSVDSGNLAGNFIALGNACREIVEGPIVATSWKCGLEDTLDLVRETLARANGHAPAPTQLIAAADAFAALLGDLPANPVRMIQRLALLAQKAETIADLAKSQEGHEEAVIWANALRAAVAAHRRDVDFLMPWTDLVGDDSEIIALCAPAFSPESLSHCCASAIEVLEQRKAKGTGQSNADALIEAFEKSARNAQLLIHRLKTIDERSKAMFEEMDFKFLFDPNRELLSIGYRGADGNLDSNFYDLLASEARLASFIAIAKGDLPAKHWFRLGRTLTPIDGGSCLISWSGSMFEYLMPSLVMRAPAGSLLEQTNRLVVRRQEEYGRGLDIPWGMSESEYNARDIEQTYQYSSFGVPDLGYKRGLSENVVVAPYASGLAAMVDPAAAAKNFRNFAEIGARGAYGWYEAIDYTRARLQDGQKFAIVRD